MPDAAQPAPMPEEIRSVEELYLTGLHLEQYRHATRDPELYYREALQRDPGESRCLVALARRDLDRADFHTARERLELAVERLTLRNPNPYDGEAFFHLGMCHRFLDDDDAAYTRFYKAAWNGAWQGASYAELARISCGRCDYTRALIEVDRSLAAGSHNRRAMMTKAIILRQNGNSDAAKSVLEQLKNIDPLFHGYWSEVWFLSGKSPGNLNELRHHVGRNSFSWIELSLEYSWNGRFREAADLLECSGCAVEGRNPLIHYYLGYFHEKLGEERAAEKRYRTASASDQGLDFVSRAESAKILEQILGKYPDDYMASYHLGNFYYHNRCYDKALGLWKQSIDANPDFPTTRRNLALGLFNKKHRPFEARAELERAFSLDESDSRILFELDQLYKKIGRSPEERLSFLEAHPENLSSRDDLTTERISLLNRVGRPLEALAELGGREFRPWEGGEGRVSSEYVRALILLSLECLSVSDFAGALEHLEKAYSYPENLGEGKLVTMTDNELDFFMGVTLAGMGMQEKSQDYFRHATLGSSEPTLAAYYNDQSSETIFFQGLAFRRLGNVAESTRRFQTLRTYGRTHFFDEPVIDYFAVSLPDLLIFDEDLTEKNRANCRYLMALGDYGLGNLERARSDLDTLLRDSPYFPGAWFFRRLWSLDDLRLA